MQSDTSQLADIRISILCMVGSHDARHFIAFNALQFFQQYEKLLTSDNYVTRRQSLKVSAQLI